MYTPGIRSSQYFAGAQTTTTTSGKRRKMYRGIREKGSNDVVSVACYDIYLSLCTQTAWTTSSEPFSHFTLFLTVLEVHPRVMRFVLKIYQGIWDVQVDCRKYNTQVGSLKIIQSMTVGPESLEDYFQKIALLGQKSALNLWYVDTRPKLFPSI